jgi:transcriptional regulator with XRE-family HTH domain
MNQEQATALGALIRQKRLELGFTTYELGAAAGVPNSTVVRIEQGKFMAPRPNKLASFAQFLGLTLADLFGPAGYLVPNELPSFDAYLNVKYPKLPAEAVREMQEHFDDLIVRMGLNFNEPSSVLEEVSDDRIGEQTV